MALLDTAALDTAAALVELNLVSCRYSDVARRLTELFTIVIMVVSNHIITTHRYPAYAIAFIDYSKQELLIQFDQGTDAKCPSRW